jgi:hypothetical protein
LVIEVSDNEYKENELEGMSLTSYFVNSHGKYYVYAEITRLDESKYIIVYEISESGVEKVGNVEGGFNSDSDKIDFSRRGVFDKQLQAVGNV